MCNQNFPEHKHKLVSILFSAAPSHVPSSGMLFFFTDQIYIGIFVSVDTKTESAIRVNKSKLGKHEQKPVIY